jgi:hypothetical protein
MTTMTNTRESGAPRKRRRVVRRLVITLIVLTGLFVGIDFAAAAMAEYQVSKRARAAFKLADDPAVTVHGFPFLTQALSGEYDQITVEANGVPIQDTLRDVQIHADLHQVNAPLSELLAGSTASLKVREVDGQVRVKANDFNRAIQANKTAVPTDITNVTIEPATEKVVNTPPEDLTDSPADESEAEAEETEDDTTAGVKVGATIDIAGQQTDVAVFGIIELDGGKIRVAPKRVDVRNALGSGLLSAALQRQILPLFAVTLDPGKLPFEVTPTAVRVDPGLISLKGEAKNVSLAGVRG